MPIWLATFAVVAVFAVGDARAQAQDHAARIQDDDESAPFADQRVQLFQVSPAVTTGSERWAPRRSWFAGPVPWLFIGVGAAIVTAWIVVLTVLVTHSPPSETDRFCALAGSGCTSLPY